jgi:hypothetical protein
MSIDLRSTCKAASSQREREGEAKMFLAGERGQERQRSRKEVRYQNRKSEEIIPKTLVFPKNDSARQRPPLVSGEQNTKKRCGFSVIYNDFSFISVKLTSPITTPL